MARPGSGAGNVLEGVGEWAAKLFVEVLKRAKDRQEKDPGTNRCVSGQEHAAPGMQNTLAIPMPCTREDGVQPPHLPCLNMEPSSTETCWSTGLRKNPCGSELSSVSGKGLDVKDPGVAQSSRASSRERMDHLSLEPWQVASLLGSQSMLYG